jgi:TPR repeat protein
MWRGTPCAMPGQAQMPAWQAPPRAAVATPTAAPLSSVPAAFPIPIGAPPPSVAPPPADPGPARTIRVVQTTRQACTDGDRSACKKVDCAAGQPRACYLTGLGLTQSATPWEGLDWLERGCELGNSAACNQLGVIHAGGGTQHVDTQRRWPPTDPDKALEHFARACSLGDSSSCRAEASRFGSGDTQRAMMRDQHVKTCMKGPPAALFGPGETPRPLGSSCRIAAWFFETGRGSQTDPARACALNRRGCGLHDPGACEAATRCK